jgi:iron complex transport system permease protein
MAKWVWFFLLGSVLAVSPFVGTASLSPDQLFETGALSNRILLELRLPRVLLGFSAGAALALAGLLFQTLFRNVLMTPYTLGVSGGAVLGAGLAIILGVESLFFGVAAVTFFGFVGALSTVLLLVWLSRYLLRAEYESLLLLGIALSFFYTAALMVVYYLSSYVESHMLMRFTMGSLSVVGYAEPLIVAAAASLLFAAVWIDRFALQLLAVSDEQARLKGVDADKVTLRLLVAASVAVGVLVSLTGPIGFVGLVVPHIVRKLYRQNVTRLIAPTALFGGLFLVACDTLARAFSFASELPIGIVTALIGGPFFVYLIIARSRR